MIYYGDFAEDDTVEMHWGSYDGGTGASITQTGLIAADVIIYKDGNIAQKTSTNGISVFNDFDGRTGLHVLTIDTSNDTGDGGFWVTGVDYQVAIDGVTIDGQTVRFWVGSFSIENRFMVGTNLAFLASVGGALADAAAVDDPTSADTLVQYAKQLVNVLIGSDGIGTWDAEQAPANGNNIAEVMRAIHADVTGLNGDVMRGTESAALAAVCTPGRLGELDPANLPADIDNILLDTQVIGALGAGLTDITDRLPAALTKGQADSGSTTTFIDAALTQADTDYWRGMWVRFTSGNLIGQTRYITAFNAGTDEITFAPPTTQAVGTHNYEILPAAATGVDWAEVIAPGATVDLSATDIQLVDTAGALTGHTNQTGDSFARLGAPAAASIAADLLVIDNLVDDLETRIPDTLSLANINAEMVDVVNVDTIALPGQEAPPLAPTQRQLLGWLYKVLRNRTEMDATEFRIYADDESTVDAKAVVSDASSIARVAELVTGP